MSTTVSAIKDDLKGMLGGASIDDVVNLYSLMERATNQMLARLDPIETVRKQALSQVIHDDLQNYALPSDYKKIIDLAPQDDRQSRDRASRSYMEPFAAELNLKNKDIAIEAREGVKFLRANWKSTSAKTLHTMNSLTDDGTISVVGSASGLKANTLYKLSGNASVEFDLTASGDGIQVLNKTNNVDLENWDEMADFIVPVWFGSVSAFTSATLLWGNDLTTKYWTPTAQTAQSDGVSVQTGWNFFLFPWVGATETGTVNPALIDSFKFTIAATGAITNIRVDNILVSLGRFFDLKYYSQYIFKSSVGTWLVRPTTDDDICILSGTSLLIYLHECRIAIAQQLTDDNGRTTLSESKKALNGDPNAPDVEGRVGLYRRYRAEHPSESKKLIGRYWNLPRFK